MRTEKSRARSCRGAAAQLTLCFALQALATGAAFPQAPAQPVVVKEFAKQEMIYRSRGADVPAGYVTGRSLWHYAEVLPAGFMDELAKLGSADRWLDIGTGGGQALLDYYTIEPDAPKSGTDARLPAKARAVGVTIEDRRTDQWRQQTASLGDDRIRYLHGKRLRDYSREELGKFRLITDVFGGFSYTENLGQFIERVLDLLETGGAFYTLMQSVHLENGKENPRTWYLTELVDPAGRDVTVCAWLKSVSCVQVTCDSKHAWDSPTELILVRKTCNDVSVPPTKLLQYEAGNPPGRRLLLEK
jgi:hypothetical protein